MMKDSVFWRAATCIGLVLAGLFVASLWYAAAQLRPARSGSRALTGDGARAGNATDQVRVLAVPAPEGESHRLYLVDTERRAIPVYGGASGPSGFSLLAARYYDVDARAAVEKEFPLNARGYSILDMNRHVSRP